MDNFTNRQPEIIIVGGSKNNFLYKETKHNVVLNMNPCME